MGAPSLAGLIPAGTSVESGVTITANLVDGDNTITHGIGYRVTSCNVNYNTDEYSGGVYWKNIDNDNILINVAGAIPGAIISLTFIAP